MADSFAKILEEIENWKVPAELETFLIRTDAPSRSDQTLSFYAYAYERAFEALADKALERWRGGGYLQLPVFYLARHSIELHLKSTIATYADYTRDPSPDCGHRLLDLWNELKRQFNLASMPDQEEWGHHCERLIHHIHNIDPTGKSFRYPAKRDGKLFDYTYVELQGLVEAHNHITTYCDASIDMLGEYAIVF